MGQGGGGAGEPNRDTVCRTEPQELVIRDGVVVDGLE